MAHVFLKMTAHGNEPPCDGCGGTFQRDEQMTAFKYENGEPAGWHCSQCCAKYQEWGRFDPDMVVKK